MRRRTEDTDSQRTPRWPLIAPVRLAIGGLLAVAMLVSGCGGSAPSSSVATLSSSTSTSSSSSSQGASSGRGAGSPGEMALAYAHCMRTHGDPSFPDPASGGRIALNPAVADSPLFKTANAACHRLLPSGAAGPSGGGMPPTQTVAAELRLARCMRTRGFPNFPDPSSNGQLLFSPGNGIDPSSPQFKAANSYCQRYLPDRGKPGALTSSSGGGGS